MSGRKFLPAFILWILISPASCTAAKPTVAAIRSTPASLPTPTPAPTTAPIDTRIPSPSITTSVSPSQPVPEYPYVFLPAPENLHAIFRIGQRSGMRSGFFSKVGDSITANRAFLVPFGLADFSLGEYAYLHEVIDFFSRETSADGNSFVRDSLAARTSWRAEHVLDPTRNLPPCAAGEMPLVCEYRIVQPAIAIILLGTNDAMAPTGSFEESYRKVVTITLNRGIIPILTTLPPMEGKDVTPYNAFIRALATSRGIPWIDLYAALAPLPKDGLTPDGVHLSWIEPADFQPRYLKYGMTMRNLITLQALDAVWRSYPTA